VVCTVRHALKQRSSGGIDYCDGGEGGAVKCDNEDCGEGNYLTRLCMGLKEAHYDSGKFHNHCWKCPDFGECIFDYRNDHCDLCGDHYFAGNSGFSCPCRGKDDDYRQMGMWGGGGGRFDDDDEDDGFDETAELDIAPVGDVSVSTLCWSGRLHGIEAEVKQRRASAISEVVQGVHWFTDEVPGVQQAAIIALLDTRSTLRGDALGEVPSLLHLARWNVEENDEDDEGLASRLGAMPDASLFQLCDKISAAQLHFKGREMLHEEDAANDDDDVEDEDEECEGSEDEEGGGDEKNDRDVE